MWRLSVESDDDLLVEMCRRLYLEDPAQLPGAAPPRRETLATLRRESWRGRAAVLEVDERVAGYALLIEYWSNELGGEVCAVDELYVALELRGRGHGTALFGAIERGEVWQTPAAVIALGVTPSNSRARRLYERLGFAVVGVSLVKRRQQLLSG